MSSTPRTTRLTMAAFAMHSIPFGAWLALIPYVKTTLDLSEGELAIALLGMPLALIPTMRLAAAVIGRVGPRKTLMAGFPLQGLFVALPLTATGQGTLFLALACLGMVFAFSEVALNTYAGRLEKERGVVVMNRCHGFWAVGLMAGSALMAALPLTSPGWTLLAFGFVAGVAGAVSARLLPHLGAPIGTPSPPRRPLSKVPAALVPIALCTLAVTMTEGAMGDWGAVYLAERLPDGAARAGIAVSIFAAFLAAGRFAGDWLKIRLGAVLLARGAILTAIAGLLCLVLPLPLFMAYAGFALLGAGCAVAFPLGISAAAALDDTYEGENIAMTSMVAVSGFLFGPPMIGGLAELFDLRIGLAALLPFLAVALVLARALAPPESHPAPDSAPAKAESAG